MILKSVTTDDGLGLQGGPIGGGSRNKVQGFLTGPGVSMFMEILHGLYVCCLPGRPATSKYSISTHRMGATTLYAGILGG